MIMILIVLGGILAVENIRMNKAYISEYIQEYDTKAHKIDPNLFSLNDDFIFDSDVNNEMLFTDVGEYDCLIKISNNNFLFVKSKTVSVKYIIKDTVAPVFYENVPTEIEIYKDCEIENIEEIFKATDLAPVTVSLDKENIDFTTVGEYTTNVYAVDEHDNVTYKEIKVKVLEPSITLDKTSLNMTVGDTETLTTIVKGKDQNVEWTSSDESIAKVGNGNITANKTGTVTITAKANGVEATCEITIKEKATTPTKNGTSSKNTNKPSNNGGSSNGGSNSNNGGSSSSNNSGESTSNSNQHNIGVGNIGKWFNSRSELVSYYNSVVAEWNRKVDNGEISREEYRKNCPAGYECYSCSHCGKWTGNYKYQR